MLISELYNLFTRSSGVTTDSRTVKAGNIFFALRGPNFNGNEFIEKALLAGAFYCVSDEPSLESEQVIVVNNTLETLQALAKYHREQFNIPFLAITGSNGKTTTKELIHAVLSSTYCTYATRGNLNNHIGIPLTLLDIKKDAGIAVIEMGANHQKEISGYCQYAMPTHGLITNCGKAHLEGFGSLEGVRKGKGELYDYLRSHNGTAFVCSDYDYLMEMSRGISQIITYGTAEAQHTGHATAGNEFLSAQLDSGTEVQTNLVGRYNITNLLAAVAVGRTFNVSEEKIIKALEDYAPMNNRSQMIEKNGNRFILDSYNANPSSMFAALENFAAIQAPDKLLFIGAMKELGNDTRVEHEALIDKIRQYQWKQAAVIGEEFENVPQEILHFKNAEEDRIWLKNQDICNCLVLIKGSRGVQLEKITE